MNWASLKEKKWGLPLYAWAAIVAVLILGVYFIYRRRGNSTASSGTVATSNLLPSASDTNAVDTGGGGGGGSLGVPDSSNPGADTTTGTSVPLADTSNIDIPTTVTKTDTTQPSAILPTSDPVTPSTSPVKPSGLATKSVAANQVLVSPNATATSLQAGVAKVGPSAVTVAATPVRAAELNHPASVKITANKTGGSANKAQGIFSIH